MAFFCKFKRAINITGRNCEIQSNTYLSSGSFDSVLIKGSESCLFMIPHMMSRICGYEGGGGDKWSFWGINTEEGVLKGEMG